MKNLLTTIVTLVVCIGSIFSASFFFGTEINDPEEMILGTWKAENDPAYEWVFLANGQHHTYRDGQLTRERSWQIVNECEGENADNEYDFAMLEIDRGDHMPSQCYVVQGLNGVLTLLSLPQGRLLIFDRAED